MSAKGYTKTDEALNHSRNISGNPQEDGTELPTTTNSRTTSGIYVDISGQPLFLER